MRRKKKPKNLMAVRDAEKILKNRRNISAKEEDILNAKRVQGFIVQNVSSNFRH